MLRRAFIVAAPLALVAGAALASEGGADKKKAEVGQYVDLQPVGLPIVVDGELVNYVFVSVRLNLAGAADSNRWRQKEPFFRDLLVRLGHRTSFAKPNETWAIDAPRLCAAFQREAVSITGPGVIKSVAVTSQTSRGRGGSAKG